MNRGVEGDLLRSAIRSQVGPGLIRMRRHVYCDQDRVREVENAHEDDARRYGDAHLLAGGEKLQVQDKNGPFSDELCYSQQQILREEELQHYQFLFHSITCVVGNTNFPVVVRDIPAGGQIPSVACGFVHC